MCRNHERPWPRPALSEREFRERFLWQYTDSAFDSLCGELDRIAAAAWSGYSNARKSPRTRKAGEGFAIPSTTGSRAACGPGGDRQGKARARRQEDASLVLADQRLPSQRAHIVTAGADSGIRFARGGSRASNDRNRYQAMARRSALPLRELMNPDQHFARSCAGNPSAK
jgi:hypothetical protein